MKREKEGRKPPKLANGPPFRPIPELPKRLEFVLAAFYELSTSRQLGMAVGPIPFEAIDRYATRYGIENFDRFRALIRVLDNAWLARQNAAKPEAPPDVVNAVSADDSEGVKALFRSFKASREA